MTDFSTKKHPTLDLLQKWLEAPEGEEKIGQETKILFTTHDFVVLDYIHREELVPEELQPRVKVLLDNGAIERVARNRFVLAKRFYSMAGKKGVYTRKKGLDR